MKNQSEMIDPWQISEKEFPEEGTTSEKWKFFLTCATLAPSCRNSQPWQFHIQGNHVDLYADRRRACPVVDPSHRELIISCGCALFNLRTAMLHFGELGAIEIFPSPSENDLLARVWLRRHWDTCHDGTTLFNAIPARRTNRHSFRDEPIPEALLEQFKAAAAEENVHFEIAVPGQKHELAALIAEAERRQWADQDFREELAVWIHSIKARRRNGIPGHAFATDDLLSSAEPRVVRSIDLGSSQAVKDEELATGPQTLGVLMTPTDDPRAWLAAGQALERILLLARAQNVWASFWNQPVEVPELRMKLMLLMGDRGLPQIVIRLGYGNDVTPTPRRPLEEVMIAQKLNMD